MSAFIAGFSLTVCDQVSAQYLPVYGGPTYDSATGNGDKFVSYVPNSTTPFTDPDVGDGLGVGYSDTYVGGVDKGRRAIRWDSSGNAIELPNLGTDASGNTNGQVWAVSAAGVAVGSSDEHVNGRSQGTQPVRWSASGAITQLGGGIGEAFAVNSNGLAVGWSNRNAARWDPSGTAVTLLPTSNPNAVQSFAFAVNDIGTAVGYSDLGGLGSRAVRWDASGTSATELGNLGLDGSGDASSIAYAINNAGTAVGYASVPGLGGDPAPVRWDASTTVATRLDGGGRAYAINSAGVAVGVSGIRAALWSPTGTAITYLANINTNINPLLSNSSDAYDINDSGIAVGFNLKYDTTIQDYTGNDAVMWMPDGSVVDLNTLIDPASGWTLTSANAIDNNDWVSGVGMFDPDGAGPLPSYQRLFLIQVPEPTSITLLAIGAVTILSRRRMKY